MKHNSDKLLLILGMLLSCMTQTAQASDKGMYSLESIQSADGFITSQPTISHYQLERVLEETDRFLQNRQASLKKSILEHSEAGDNIFLAAIMPGGLLYLAYHKGQQSSAENSLVAAQQSQQEFLNDRTRMKLEAPVTILLARFP
jgi:hypothetical protein